RRKPLARRYQLPAVPRESQGNFPALVPREGVELLTGLHVPDLHVPAAPPVTGRGQEPAIRAVHYIIRVVIRLVWAGPETEELGETDPVQVVPIPVAEGGRAFVEVALGPGDVVVEPLEAGQGNPFRVEFGFGPFPLGFFGFPRLRFLFPRLLFLG